LSTLSRTSKRNRALGVDRAENRIVVMAAATAATVAHRHAKIRQLLRKLGWTEVNEGAWIARVSRFVMTASSLSV
jgi:hypothetical protein